MNTLYSHLCFKTPQGDEITVPYRRVLAIIKSPPPPSGGPVKITLNCEHGFIYECFVAESVANEVIDQWSARSGPAH